MRLITTFFRFQCHFLCRYLDLLLDDFVRLLRQGGVDFHKHFTKFELQRLRYVTEITLSTTHVLTNEKKCKLLTSRTMSLSSAISSRTPETITEEKLKKVFLYV